MTEQLPTSETISDEAMSFWEHLDELRSRLLKAAVAAAIGGSIAWFYRVNVLNWLAVPFIESFPTKVAGAASLHVSSPAGFFITYVKLSIIAGLVFALPVILFQVWSFIAPGLYAKEKRIAIPFVVTSCLLFAGGSLFGWKFAFPRAFQFMLSFAEDDGLNLKVQPTVMIDTYIDFVSKMLLAFGAVFELPLVIFFLSILKVIHYRQLLSFSRYFVVIAFGLSAVLTPPDLFSQFLMAVPLCLLYGISIFVAMIFGPKPPPIEEA